MHFGYDDPSLLFPGLIISVEDTILEEIFEPVFEEGTFGEVLEVGLEHVLNIGRRTSHGSIRSITVSFDGEVEGEGGLNSPALRSASQEEQASAS